ncbi:MAG: UxaA family hydrolase [Planctomycetota bacterium]|nr:UxaA family hydrolase [Planctomycetota bacterium]
MSADPVPTELTLQQCAVQVHPADNVVVVRDEVQPGTLVKTPDGVTLTISGVVTPGNRFATVEIADGEVVRQYNQPIGTSRGIRAGDPVTALNMSDEVPVVRDLPGDLESPAPDYLPESERSSFLGYRRADGRVGTRNWILVVPTSMCASHEAQQIALRAELTLIPPEFADRIDGVVAIPHNKGCGCPDGSNVDVVLQMLATYAGHPNVGGVLFIDLGCEKTNKTYMEQHLGGEVETRFGKPAAWIGVQQCGGTQGTIDQGLKEIEAMMAEVVQVQREEASISELVLGVECGGSDGYSGLSANPALGFASDLLVQNGGTVILSEVPEWCGAEHVLANRAKDAATGDAVYELVDWYKKHAARNGATLGENPSPGNVAGGLLNITIKSLGAIAKGGTTRVEGTTDYGVPPSGRGLQLMQGPGYDQESVPGLVASGATAVVFTTGRGTTIGNAIVPVVKLASNTSITERMPNDIDLSAGGVIDGKEGIEDVGHRVFEFLHTVAGGEAKTCAERNMHREFQIWSPQAMSL